MLLTVKHQDVQQNTPGHGKIRRADSARGPQNFPSWQVRWPVDGSCYVNPTPSHHQTCDVGNGWSWKFSRDVFWATRIWSTNVSELTTNIVPDWVEATFWWRLLISICFRCSTPKKKTAIWQETWLKWSPHLHIEALEFANNRLCHLRVLAASSWTWIFSWRLSTNFWMSSPDVTNWCWPWPFKTWYLVWKK